MKTRYEQMSNRNSIDGYHNFLGNDEEYRNWYGVIGRSRDSTALERSNFRVALKMLGGESENIRVERYRHWAVGWIEEVYVKPETDEYKIAAEIERRLDNYPVLDDEDYCKEEMNEADEIWKNCFDVKTRITYIRENRNQFDFNGLVEILHCVRGKAFYGYASALID